MYIMDNMEDLDSNGNIPFMEDLENSPLISSVWRRRDGHRNNSDEAFTNMPETEQSYHSALIFMVFLMTIGIVLVVATIPVDHTLSTAPGHAVVKSIQIMCSVFVGCVYIWFLRNKKKLEQKGDVSWSRLHKIDLNSVNSSAGSTLNIQSRKDALTQNAETHCSLTGAIIVLGCGGTILNFTYMIDGIICLMSMDRKPTVSEALYPVCFAFFCFTVVLQMVFFKAYDGARFESRSIFHYAFAVWIAADWWHWFAMTATPLVDATADEGVTNETYMCLVNLTAMSRFTEDLQTYLKPMNIEYATVSIGVLFQLWGTMTNRDATHQKNKRSFCTGLKIQNPCTLPLTDSDITDEHATSSQLQITFKGIFKKYTCVIVVTSVLGLINLVLQIEISEQYGIPDFIDKHDHKRDTTIRSIIIWLLTLFLILPTILLLIPSTRTLKHPIPGKYSLGMNDYLLLFTSAFIFIYDLLRLGAVVGLMQMNTKKDYLMALFGLAFSSGFTLQTCMQTKFLITVQRNKAMNKRSNERILAFLLHLSITNAFYWFIICFAHESHMDIFAPIMTEFFGSDQVGKRRMQMIGVICVPFMSLYRFHSAVLAYELVKSRSRP